MKNIRFIIFWVIAFALISLVKTQFYNYAMADSSAAAKLSGVPIGFDQLPVKGMVTMIDLGATECIPCKMMAPVMQKVEADYQDKAVIAFIDVWKNREQAPKYNIRAIPTQIFFDPSGKEVFRHQGFMSEKDIVAQLTKMGVTLPTGKKD